MRGKDLLTTFRERIGRVSCRFELLLQPRLEFVWRLGNDEKCHVGVLVSAEFGALPTKAPFLVSLDPHGCGVSGQEIAFAVNVRRPEAVNHVTRGAIDDHRDADGNVTEEVFLKDGALEGEAILYSGGRIRARLLYSGGKQNGAAVYYGETGQVSMKMNYVDGKLDGESQYFDEQGKLVIYRAFIESELDVPKHLARRVHDFYFNPQYEEFKARTLWSLSNAFTSAFKELDAIPQFRVTAKLGPFLDRMGCA